MQRGEHTLHKRSSPSCHWSEFLYFIVKGGWQMWRSSSDFIPTQQLNFCWTFTFEEYELFMGFEIGWKTAIIGHPKSQKSKLGEKSFTISFQNCYLSAFSVFTVIIIRGNAELQHTIYAYSKWIQFGGLQKSFSECACEPKRAKACPLDLDRHSKMIITFESILTNFKVSIIFWGIWGSSKNWLKPKTEPHYQV